MQNSNKVIPSFLNEQLKKRAINTNQQNINQQNINQQNTNQQNTNQQNTNQQHLMGNLQINTQHKDLWDKLEESKKLININGQRTMTFKQIFDQYNSIIGNSLTKLKEQPQSIQGRDTEIAMLYAVLERPKTPVALLLGQAGVGKTALVEEFGKQLNSGQYATALSHKYLLIALRLGNLAAIGTQKLQSELAKMMDQLKTIENYAQEALDDPSIRVVLFIDEVHMLVTIFGPGTKIGGDVIKDVLARSPIRVIAATTRREYDSTIIVDKPLSERFKQIEMHELSPKIVEDICLDWWSKVAPDCPMPTLQILRKVIQANALYRSDSAEPRKTLDILEDFVSYCRRTKLPVDNQVVDKIFKDRYSINLSFIVDPDVVYNEIASRVKGQPHALFLLKRLVRSMVFQLDPMSNKPIATALFTGPTGVGKTETTKAIAETLYPGENVLLNINMPDYKTPEHEAGFRKRIGEYVRHTPNAIILLDEFEKAHSSIRDAMLTILDEGLISFDVTNREGAIEVNTVSLRNTIVIATTNEGHEVFKNDAKFSQRSVNRDEDEVENYRNKAEIDQLMKSLVNYLQKAGFRPEMINRFTQVIPFRGLTDDTLVMIAENEIKSLISKFETVKNIKIVINEPKYWDLYKHETFDIALYIARVKAQAHNPNSGGARAIRRHVNTELYYALVDAIIENPNSTTFKAQVTQDTKIYNTSRSASEGGIEIYAID